MNNNLNIANDIETLIMMSIAVLCSATVDVKITRRFNKNNVSKMLFL